MQFDDDDYHYRDNDDNGRGLADLGVLLMIVGILFCYFWLLIEAVRALIGDMNPQYVSRGQTLLFVWAGWIVALICCFTPLNPSFFLGLTLVLSAPLAAHILVTLVCSFLPFSQWKFFAIYRIVLLLLPILIPYGIYYNWSFKMTSTKFVAWLLALIVPELSEIFYDIRSYFSRRIGSRST
jgi:hypothetical protein